MADFCTVEDVANILQVEIAANNVSCLRAIEEATAAIRNYCHQQIEKVEDDEIILDVWIPRWNVALPEMPVLSIASVVEDETLLAEGADEDYILVQYGELLRRGRRWKVGPQILTVRYTHGHDPIPDDVNAVCTRAASRIYQAGLRASADAGVPGVASKSLGDFSVAYTSGAGGGVGEGVMGVSGSRMLLLSEKDTLNRYRYRGI